MAPADVLTGKILWSENKGGIFRAGMIRVADDRVLVLDDSGTVRLLQHDPKGIGSWRERRRVPRRW